jgi:hypothetical protein
VSAGQWAAGIGAVALFWLGYEMLEGGSTPALARARVPQAPPRPAPPRALRTLPVLPPTVKTRGRAEALAWIRDNPERQAFGANVFDSNAQAARFVEGLYSAGAARVIVGGIRAPRPQDGSVGPSADTLFVTLPGDAQKIRAIVSFVQDASDGPDEFSRLTPPARISDRIRGGISAEQLRGGNTLRLWWD